MSFTFLRGTKRQLFQTLDIPYGYIFVEGYEPLMVICEQQGRTVLKDAVEAEKLTADEAQRIEAAVVECLLKNMWEVVLRASEFEVPADFVPKHKFALCECSWPLPHGRIQKVDSGDDVSDKIDNLQNGLAVCDSVVNEGSVHVLDTITVFRQMLDANLPEDREDRKKQYEALSKDVRQRLEEMKKVQVSIATLSIPPELARVLFGHD